MVLISGSMPDFPIRKVKSAHAVKKNKTTSKPIPPSTAVKTTKDQKTTTEKQPTTQEPSGEGILDALNKARRSAKARTDKKQTAAWNRNLQ